ncbi:MAG: tRNA (adenosine(37)-N6)-dimethylallyltransferase MiaA [Bacilli bacterium]|nr:tRNA (adenosine(37)-N6)-dimethylallyltransferase MiaA [Bacilli bacterium]
MLIVVCGPTGVGKSDLSIKLAQTFNAEIINADSMQVYKKMDIATAKVTKEEQALVKHHLLDIKNYDEDYSIYDYQKDARAIIDNNPDKNYIIVGGSGLYIKSLLYNYKFSDEDTTNDYDDLSNEDLFYAAILKDDKMNIHVNNRKRLVRFLNKEKAPDEEAYLMYPNTIFIGLTMDREALYEKVANRVYQMKDMGLIEEARYFYDFHKDTKSLRTVIGYKELFPYFDNQISLEEALDNIIKNTRHYIKRQYTFFKNQFDLKWFDVTSDTYLEDVINYIKNQ